MSLKVKLWTFSVFQNNCFTNWIFYWQFFVLSQRVIWSKMSRYQLWRSWWTYPYNSNPSTTVASLWFSRYEIGSGLFWVFKFLDLSGLLDKCVRCFGFIGVLKLVFNIKATSSSNNNLRDTKNMISRILVILLLNFTEITIFHKKMTILDILFIFSMFGDSKFSVIIS